MKESAQDERTLRTDLAVVISIEQVQQRLGRIAHGRRIFEVRLVAQPVLELLDLNKSALFTRKSEMSTSNWQIARQRTASASSASNTVSQNRRCSSSRSA